MKWIGKVTVLCAECPDEKVIFDGGGFSCEEFDADRNEKSRCSD